jgi:hypothetical protein
MRTCVVVVVVLCGCARAPSSGPTAPAEGRATDERRVEWLPPSFGALTFTWLVDGRREHYGVGG